MLLLLLSLSLSLLLLFTNKASVCHTSCVLLYKCLFLSLLCLGQITDEESLFTYAPGESTATFTNASFEPMFVENIEWADNATRDAARSACAGDAACLFDAASTNDVSIGTNSKDVSVQLVKENEELGKPISGGFC